MIRLQWVVLVTNITAMQSRSAQAGTQEGSMSHDPVLERYVGPAVVCVRGPSRSGKTAMVERLVAALASSGRRSAYLKRTHHELDLPEKASARVWAQQPAAMVLRATDRLQVTTAAGDASVESLLAGVPDDVDVVLLETHSAEPYPTIRATNAEPGPQERLVGTWTPGEPFDEAAARVLPAVLAMMPADPVLDHALRAAMRVHGGHACAGLVLGTRLALLAAATLGLEVPDRQKRLIVTVETDRCAVDAVQAVTGCRPGKRTLRLLDYGKLAATFIDQWKGEAVRVAVRGDLRDRIETPDGADRHEAQRGAYLAMPLDELFQVCPADAEIAQFDLPGPPRRRVHCGACGEEVSDGREVMTDLGPRCRPCAGATNLSAAITGG
jgi:formylmethanofuran dehydrogenase subunit E